MSKQYKTEYFYMSVLTFKAPLEIAADDLLKFSPLFFRDCKA